MSEDKMKAGLIAFAVQVVIETAELVINWLHHVGRLVDDWTEAMVVRLTARGAV